MTTFLLDSSPLVSLAPRRPDSHKGDFGRALLIGGSLSMSGAISLAGLAALRGGAGLVRLAVPAPCHPIVAGFDPSYLVTPLAAQADGSLCAAARPQLDELIPAATAVACGPGLTTGQGVLELIPTLYRSLRQPAVFDADALNALAKNPQSLAHPAGVRVLTPHPGEFGRLSPASRYSPADRERLAADFARQHGVILVLKGHRTVVSDGERVFVNTTGNAGMATGGTGDVLTGLLVALLCQNLQAYEAARLAVYLHGLAGDLAAAKLGQPSLIASDLLDFLPAALKHHQTKAELP
jgi:NAD(P)H-hydrate epimerase